MNIRGGKPEARLTQQGNALLFESSYDAGLVAALKAQIPANARRWDVDQKAWLVDPGYAHTCVMLAMTYLGITINAPTAQTQQAAIRLLEVRYIGQTKPRDGQTDRSAYGYCERKWSVLFPEAVLRSWFEAPATPTQHVTLYSVLFVKQAASAEEIKSAYRRMAKQWHPDVCREPDAAEQFKRINEAYLVLSDAQQRKRYDMGLALEAQHGSKRKQSLDAYHPPLRCGYILATGHDSLGTFVVDVIHQWEDIVVNGQTLVTSWPKGADMFVEELV